MTSFCRFLTLSADGTCIVLSQAGCLIICVCAEHIDLHVTLVQRQAMTASPKIAKLKSHSILGTMYFTIFVATLRNCLPQLPHFKVYIFDLTL